MDWDSLIDEDALAAVLPGDYARFARPIAAGLAVFLGALPQSHQTELLNEQASLSPTATISERLAVLARRCPVLHKLGQILARDQRLAPELRHHLRTLESLTPTVPLPAIQQILQQELGPLDRRGVTLLPPAIAEASVAVVIPFQQPSSDRSADSQQGVFKILKPGIEQRLDLELGLMERVGAYLDEECDALQIPHLDYQESFQQVRDKLRCEVQLDREQRLLTQAQACYADEPRVQIPALLEHCTARVTAMQRVSGGKVTDHSLDCGAAKRGLAELVVKAIIARPIFSRSGQALFHSDPHAGNLFHTTDNRLAILDWSLAGSLGESERVAIVQIMLGAITLHNERIVDVLTELSQHGRIDRQALEAVVRARLARIRQGEFPGLSWLIGMLDEAVQTARLRVAADLMLFRKTLHTLEGVVAEIGAEGFELDDVLCREFLRHFVTEWPRRWFALPSSRQYATRLSNLDLTQAALSYPATIARYWIG